MKISVLLPVWLQKNENRRLSEMQEVSLRAFLFVSFGMFSWINVKEMRWFASEECTFCHLRMLLPLGVFQKE
ncbi:MAG TPA: hypothetical protein DCZ73_01575 [Bacteroides sp.]|nr:hypothetical protein [Bacteroides sp.]